MTVPKRIKIIVAIFPICSSRDETYKQTLRDELDDLDYELQKLMEAKESVMKRIEDAEKGSRIMKRTKKVENWTSRVEALKLDVEDFTNQVSQKNTKKKHKSTDLRSKVNDLRERLCKLEEEEKDFDVVVEKIVSEQKLTDDDSLYMNEESAVVIGMEAMVKQIWECMDGQDQMGIVGLYGMGGVGKTTLLKQIKKKVVENWNDCRVIWASVQPLDDEELRVERIQKQILRQIGLFEEKLEETEIKSVEDKETSTAEAISVEGKIFNFLSQNKFVLLLDDVWQMIDLEQIGVPFPGKGSKIVFTTRSLEVCCLMEAEAEFKLECLPYDYAWELFSRTVGGEILDKEALVREIADSIVRECHGLPLALVTIGRAMALKEAKEWKNELQGINSSSSGSGAKLRTGILSSLKLSYDLLEEDVIKSCFLYCVLYPSDYRIHKRDLIDYWIGEELLIDRVGAPNEGYNVIDVLVSACLLEEEGEDYVKIHGLVLEMMLWIISEFEKKEDVLVRANADLTKPPEVAKWKDMTKVSLMKNQINNLSEFPYCPHLQTLFLKSNPLENIDNILDGSMPSLKVLNLSENYSLHQLPSQVSSLEHLKILDLSRTGITELPIQMKKLENLICLNLEHTFQLSMIPRNLISSFFKLRVLRLLSCGSVDSILDNSGELLIEELVCLKQLNMLSITLRSNQPLQKYLSSRKLLLCTQSLELQSLKSLNSLTIELTYLNHLKALCISGCELEELKIDFGREVHSIHESSSFPFLEKVIVDQCSKLQDMTWLILAPNLKQLTVSKCSSMEEVINVGKLSEFPEMMANLQPFSKLKVLRLVDLPNLKTIYWTYLPLPDLKCPPEIDKCNQLKMFGKHTSVASVDPFPSSSSSSSYL